jgi:hypothetical protein
MLSKGEAVVHKMHPFTIRHRTRLLENSILQEQEFRIDDGAKQTGIALTLENRIVKHLGEIHHRQNIKSNIDTRRGYRRCRRALKYGYRKPKFAPAIRKSKTIKSLTLVKKTLADKKGLTPGEMRTLYKVHVSPEMDFNAHYVSIFKANGRGSRALPRTNACGIKIKGSEKPRKKGIFGFVTGDIVEANVTDGKQKGVFMGRIAVKSSGYFVIVDSLTGKKVDGVKHVYMRKIQRNSGWEYSYHKRLLP